MITPEQMLEDAQQLLNVVPHEGRRRTIISRAYYAAYHFLLEHPCCADFVRPLGKGTHSALLKFLSESREPNVQHTAAILTDLYGRRIEADYRPHMHVLRNSESDCVEDATYIMEETLVEYDPAKDQRAP